MDPKLICFDAFDTLVRLSDPAPRLVERFAELGLTVPYELAAEAFRDEIRYYRSHCLTGRDEPGLDRLRRRCATIMGERVATGVPHRLGVEALVDILMGSLEFTLADGCAVCLQTLAERGVTLAVVSNWDCSLPLVLARLGIRDRFAAVAVSAVVGREKPDPALWQAVLDELAVRPEQAWHVGDEPEADAAGALAAGLTPVLIGPARAPEGVRKIASLAELPGLLGPPEESR